MGSPNSKNRVIVKKTTTRGVRKVAGASRTRNARTVDEHGLPRGGDRAAFNARQRAYGGELIVSGDMDDRLRKDIRAAIARLGKNAASSTERGRVIVRTADQHQAVTLGKKLHRAHKGGRLTISWTDDEAPVRVRWATGA